MKPENLTILAVDDTPANIRLLTHYMEKQGYNVITAEDGFEGFKAAIQYHPDLILLDVMMPGTDGYEVCELLKTEEATKDIPVMFLTAKSDVEDKIKGFELGAVDYIVKPFNLVEISTRVRNQLELKCLEKQNQRYHHTLMDLQRLASLGNVGDGVMRYFNDELKRIQKQVGQAIQGSHLEEKEKKELNGSLDSIENMIKMVQNWICITNSDQHDKHEVNINPILEDVLELVQIVIKGKTQIDFQQTEKKYIVEGDTVLLHQAFMNIFMNAVEATLSGGTICVSIQEKELPNELKSELQGDIANSYVLIEISDNGKRDKSASYKPEMDLFFAIKDQKQTGLRFSATYGIVKDHHGIMKVQNKNGEGVSVFIYLPSIS